MTEHRLPPGSQHPNAPRPPSSICRLSAKILLQRQEDLSLKDFGPPLAETIGGPWEEGGPSQTPPKNRPQHETTVFSVCVITGLTIVQRSPFAK